MSVKEGEREVASYQYDPFGRRISKIVNGITTCFIYTDEGLLAELDEKGNIQVAYGWQPDTLWGTSPLWQANLATNQTLQTANYHYLITDHLGTSQLAINSQGQQTWKAVAETFGKTQLDTANQMTMNLRFPGQYFDKETNLHYNGFRHYNPELGRYIQADPLGVIGGMNIYGYGYANPLFNYDPYGLWSFKNAFDPAFWLVNKILPDAVTDAITKDNFVNGVAGFGDTMSFGFSKKIRDDNDIGSVDECSKSYNAGVAVAVVYDFFLTKSAAKSASFRSERGRWKSKGKWVTPDKSLKKYHFHLGRSDIGLGKKHLPYQLSGWYKNLKAIAKDYPREVANIVEGVFGMGYGFTSAISGGGKILNNCFSCECK